MAEKRKRNFLKELADAAKDIDDPEAKAILRQVIEFTLKGEFSGYSKARELIATQSLATGVDDMTVALGAAYLGIGENNFIKRRTAISNELYSLFGEDFFRRLRKVPVDKGLKDLVANVIDGVNIFDYVPVDVVTRAHFASKLEKTDEEVYAPQDCVKELNFLRKYSLPRMWESFNSLDMGKLSYLLGILEGKGQARDREGILRQLTVEDK